MTSDYERIEAAIHFLESNYQRQPNLEEVAAALNLSPFHLQRTFRQWAGVSPKRFLEFLTVEHAKRLLEESRSVLETSYEVGLSGPSRLHDHFVSLDAMTPGEFKSGGEGLIVRYGVYPSPFGPAFLAGTDRGICALSFLGERTAAEAARDLQRRWSRARAMRDDVAIGAIGKRVFSNDEEQDGADRVSLFVQGTNFQIQVWKALLRVPPGFVCSYQDIARSIGRPTASRAVGGAVGANPVAYLIPCHRVLRSAGELGGYRWGEARKRAMLAWESSNRQAA